MLDLFYRFALRRVQLTSGVKTSAANPLHLSVSWRAFPRPNLVEEPAMTSATITLGLLRLYQPMSSGS